MLRTLVLAAALTFGTSAMVSFKNTTNTAASTPAAEVCFKVKNDTGASVTLHTGSGTVPMNSGIQKEFCLEVGKKLYLSDKGKKGKVLVEVTADVAGKKYNLSDLM